MPVAKLIAPTTKQEIPKLRVAAYCRVSSNSADQRNSFATQERVYTKYIAEKQEWELVDIFADEGLSGMKADNRPEFQRMIRMCELHQIDLILTKSVSRFARNAKEALNYTRKLKLLGIGVQFEEDGINTLAMADEMLLNTFAAIAQEESESISQNERLSIVKRMERGEYIATNVPYGYRLIDKKLVVYEPEAKIVRWIFDAYLNGMSATEIARELTAQGIPTKDNKANWKSNRLTYMLSNERYAGHTLHQKFYSKYALTEVLHCAECGSRYKRVTWNIRGKKKIVWRCVSRLDYGKKYCKNSITAEEEALHGAVVRALRRFHAEDESTYLTLMKATIGEAIGINGGSEEIDLLTRRIDTLNKRMLDLVNETVAAGKDVESSEDEFKGISDQIEQLNRRIAAIQENVHKDGSRQARLEEIQNIIAERNANETQYDDSIVRQMIECIKVHSDGRLTIIFGSGYKIEEAL